MTEMNQQKSGEGFSAASNHERRRSMTSIKNPNGRLSRFLFWLRWNIEGRA